MSQAALDLLATFKLVRDALAESNARHAFIGALPVLAWGRIRTTTDIDLVIATNAEQFARAAFARQGDRAR